ncbi:PREDICTED: leucine-rich repeat LGI family member 4-like [Branchiostoma belcheri]|uniref:Leucine-rich repeat LGI family member 4-like n=1 Tax=Branchiostoma belcheri TaxID=7741 RepID=A0A6P5AQ10_BRABE|nr:PREDICTED: leucine-rich repeat LGI family member 4-like [Branchiostoma belcheri]
MAVSGLLMLLMLVYLWTGCSCLPDKCRIQKQSYIGIQWVDCDSLNLTTIPDGIPLITERFCALRNNIGNVTCLPSLPRLRYLDLGMNSIESFSWMSLRNLPELRSLYLKENRLRYVQLGRVIEHLPKLKDVNLSYNKLTSLSQYDLGWPQLNYANILGNPFHCDCDLFWLIVKMACLEACKGGNEKACCLSCSACFLIDILKYDKKLFCRSPSELKYLLLSNASARLQECREQAAPSTTRQGIFVWKPTSPQLGLNPTTNAKPRVGQTQTMVTTILHGTARYDTRPTPTQKRRVVSEFNQINQQTNQSINKHFPQAGGQASPVVGPGTSAGQATLMEDGPSCRWWGGRQPASGRAGELASQWSGRGISGRGGG